MFLISDIPDPMRATIQAIIISYLLGAVSILLLINYEPIKTPKTDIAYTTFCKKMAVLGSGNFSSVIIYALMKLSKLPAVSIAQPKFMSPIPMQKAKWIR